MKDLFEKPDFQLFKALVHVETETILDYSGDFIENDIENIGSRYWSDLSYAEVPTDIGPFAVFEGKGYWSSFYYYEGGMDCEPIVNGSWRKLNDEEWKLFCESGYAWNSPNEEAEPTE